MFKGRIFTVLNPFLRCIVVASHALIYTYCIMGITNCNRQFYTCKFPAPVVFAGIGLCHTAPEPFDVELLALVAACVGLHPMPPCVHSHQKQAAQTANRSRILTGS